MPDGIWRHIFFAGMRTVLSSLGVAATAILMASQALAAPMGWDETPIVERNVDVLRYGAADSPRSVWEQELYLGWPLYRTRQGQTAFNTTMATLIATAGKTPPAERFGGCKELKCQLDLPDIPDSGWIPAGRLWLSPDSYMLIVHAPRRPPAFVQRRSRKTMRYFVFHEFHNATRNTDPFDTISSHNQRVFVPFYLSKTRTDRQGRRFVALIQVAPHDVRSIHASNKGSAGPGIEVSNNYGDPLEPLQAEAGVIVATIVKQTAPQLRVVHHRGNEGRPMLRAYMERIKWLRKNDGAARVKLPFVPATPQAVGSATGQLAALLRPEAGMAGSLASWQSYRAFAAASQQPTLAPPAPKLARAPALAPPPVRKPEPPEPAPSMARAALTAFLTALTGKTATLLAPPKRAVPPWCKSSINGLWDERCQTKASQ